MATPCHFIIEGNPALVYASRNGSPDKVMKKLEPFLEKFWQERDLAGPSTDTPEYLTAQIVVRFGYEICEDDFSNLKVGLNYDSKAQYLYWIGADRSIQVWVAGDAYRANPALGIQGCTRTEATSLAS